MTANVRRLVWDIPPLRRFFIAILILAVLGADYAWAMRPESFLHSALLAGFFLFSAFTRSLSKIAVWRHLPVSRKDIGRASWWCQVGLPGLGILVLLFGLTGFLQGLGKPHPAWTNVLLLAGAQFAVIISLLLVTLSADFVLRHIGGIGGRAIPLLLMIALFWAILSPNVLTPASDPVFAAAGVAAWIVAGVLYGFAEHWPQPLLPRDIGARHSQRDRASTARQQSNENAWRQFGWPAMVPLYVRYMAIACAICVLVFTFLRLQRPSGNTSIAASTASVLAVMMVALFWLRIGVQTLRAFRGLPVSCATLAAFFQVSALLAVVVPVAVLAAIGLAINQTTGVLVPIQLPIMLACASLFVPIGMRIVASSGFIAGVSLCAAISPVMTLLLRREPPVLVAALSLAVIAIAWAWTYWELSRGTRAYRARPMVPMRWRGSGA